MNESPTPLPSSESAVQPVSMTNEQELLSDTARDEVQAFLDSPREDAHEAAEAATSAIEEAVDAQVPLEDLSAALESSPEAVRAIVDHDIDLEDLHPDNNTD